jgi:hypothetical protein
MNHQISEAEARELTQRYRSNVGQMLTPEYSASLPICEGFDANSIRALIDQPGCKELRIYLGMKADLSTCMIITAVDEHGADILSHPTSQEPGIILEYGKWCPPNCSENPL